MTGPFSAPPVPRATKVLLLALLVLGTVCSRPNVLGETLSTVAVGAMVVGAAISIAIHGREARLAYGSGLVLLLSASTSIWVLMRAPYTNPLTLELIRGEMLNTLALIAWAVVLGSLGAAPVLLRVVVAIVLVQSSSQFITMLLRFAGFPDFVLGSFSAGEYTADIHFPISLDVGQIYIPPVNVPRFSGLGREPGWMSMYAAFVWFVWPLVGKPTIIGRIILMCGILAPISTAGFGVFVVVLGLSLVIRAARRPSLRAAYLGVAASLVVVSLSIYLALFAPVFGLSAKSTQSAASLSERDAATRAGLDALGQLSFGQRVEYPRSDINLIAAIASKGWPYALLFLLTLAVPLLVSRRKAALVAPVAVLALTIVLAQPPGGSVFILVLTICLNALFPREAGAASSASGFRSATLRSPVDH